MVLAEDAPEGLGTRVMREERYLRDIRDPRIRKIALELSRDRPAVGLHAPNEKVVR